VVWQAAAAKIAAAAMAATAILGVAREIRRWWSRRTTETPGVRRRHVASSPAPGCGLMTMRTAYLRSL
jgi:hypothetical protein